MQASSNLDDQHIGTKRPRSAIESINISSNFWKTSPKDCGVGKRQVYCWDGTQGPVYLKATESNNRTSGCRELLNTRRAPTTASLRKFAEFSSSISDTEVSSIFAEDSAMLREAADEV